MCSSDLSQEAQDKWRDETISFYGDGADEELFCIPSQGGGAYLSLSMLEACQDETIPVVNLTCQKGFVDLPKAIREAEIKEWCDENLGPLLEMMPENYPTYFGEDFGRSGDLSV